VRGFGEADGSIGWDGTPDLYAIVDELTDKGCAVQFVSESGLDPVS
jgi:hypothetical protein